MIYDKQYLKKTKIVATLGPATDSPEILLEMMQKGTDVFRINFSHADYPDVKRKIDTIHQLNNDHGYNTAILADLQGPKLRIGKMEHEDFVINQGDILTFTNEDVVGTKEKVFMTYKRFAQDVQVGENILIDDGKLISDWARESVSIMNSMKIMEGVSDTEFAPKVNYTVEQAIATMVRLYNCY